MAVEVSTTRKAVEITWDAKKLHSRTVDVRATNVADGDVSTRDDLKNDGRATLTFPKDFHGESHITVTGRGGVETGTIKV